MRLEITARSVLPQGQTCFELSVFHSCWETNLWSTFHLVHCLFSTFECPWCEKSFQSEATLLSHVVSHVKRSQYVCHLCDQAFYTVASVKSHYKSHLQVCAIMTHRYIFPDIVVILTDLFRRFEHEEKFWESFCVSMQNGGYFRKDLFKISASFILVCPQTLKKCNYSREWKDQKKKKTRLSPPETTWELTKSLCLSGTRNQNGTFRGNWRWNGDQWRGRGESEWTAKRHR